MDYLEEKLDQLQQKLKNSSLRRTLGIYIILALLGVILCFAVTVMFCESWRNLIMSKYEVSEKYHQVSDSIYLSYGGNVTMEDQKLLHFFEVAQPISLLLYSLVAIFLATSLFYRNKLREPIEILREEAVRIQRNDLSYECQYESGDEMGEICYAFDQMRKQLVENQKLTWNLMEDQRSLNAAFAHDLRTPITVMQGYLDLLLKYYPEGKITQDKLLSTLILLQEQTLRLQKFSETMKKIHTFDSLQVVKKKVSISALCLSLQRIADGLAQVHPVTIRVENQIGDKECFIDEHVVLEVAENLLSNAVRYASSSVDIKIEKEEGILHLYVRDDGRGFTEEELYQAQRPYYSDKTGGLEHFGIGLTICKALCEKHGGGLSFSNSIKGGAIVCADFFVL